MAEALAAGLTLETVLATPAFLASPAGAALAARLPAPPVGLLISDEEVIRLARQRASDLQATLGDNYHFYVGSEAGLHSIEIDGKMRYFVRNWTVVRGLVGEAARRF